MLSTISKMNYRRINEIKSEAGQVLLFVVVTMTVALALGVGVSLQTISTISDVADTDTAQRVLAAAEGGGERALSLKQTDLANLANAKKANNLPGYQNLCAPAFGDSVTGEFLCKLNFTPAADSGDPILLESQIGVEYFTFNKETQDGTPYYEFALGQNKVKEVVMNESKSIADIKVCWTGEDGLFYTSYSNSANFYRQDIICPVVGCPSGVGSNAISSTASDISGFNQCATLSTGDYGTTPKGLRFRTLGADTRVAVVTASPFFPPQGIKITSTGLLAVPGQHPIKKIVRVYRSFAYAPAPFDFAIYSESELSK